MRYSLVAILAGIASCTFAQTKPAAGGATVPLSTPRAPVSADATGLETANLGVIILKRRPESEEFIISVANASVPPEAEAACTKARQLLAK